MIKNMKISKKNYDKNFFTFMRQINTFNCKNLYKFKKIEYLDNKDSLKSSCINIIFLNKIDNINDTHIL